MGIPALFPVLQGKVFNISPLNMMLHVGFLYMPFIILI